MTPEKKALWRMWHYAHMDSKALFGIERDERSSLKQADIKAACDEVGIEASEELRVVPGDPTKPCQLCWFALEVSAQSAAVGEVECTAKLALLGRDRLLHASDMSPPSPSLPINAHHSAQHSPTALVLSVCA